MKRISWLLIIVFFLSVVMPGVNLLWELNVAADTLRAAKITAVQGDVKILRAGGEKHFPAFKSMGLTQGDTVITGKDGRVTLEIAADKELKIGENSRVMISELVQSDSTNADKTSLNLKAGQVYTNIKGKLSPDAKYEIRTPTAVMGVRGTQFFVTLASGVQAKVVTLEGNVVVTVPQLVTLEDGTTITQDVEIEVQPNQIFVQTGDMTDTGKYDLSTLTGDVALSLFVLETLKEISEEQPDLINPEILQNLEDMIERAREEQQQQQQQQEMLQQLQPNIQFDTIGTTSGGTTGGASGNTSGDNDDDDYAEQPRVVINTQLDDISIRYGIDHGRSIHINTNPSSGVVLQVNIQNENIAEANVSGNNITIFGLQPGSTRITVTASRTGYLPAEKSFMFTVVPGYEEGGWYKTKVSEDGSYTDIVLDSKGMPHIIYQGGTVKYRHWNGSGWPDIKDEVDIEDGVYRNKGSLSMVHNNGKDYSFISSNIDGYLGYKVYDGESWMRQTFEDENMVVESSSISTIKFGEFCYTGVTYYDSDNGDLYYRVNIDSTDDNYNYWSEEILVDGEFSNAGEASALAFDESGRAYIAYYEYSNEYGEYGYNGGLKLAIIDDLYEPEIVYRETLDDQVGCDYGQYVSIAVSEGETPAVHIAYYDAVNKVLRYARWVDEEWYAMTVDEIDGYVGQFASLALDSDGNPHISYYADGNWEEELRYAYYDPSEDEWIIETVDSGDEVGQFSSIVFDKERNVPHIAYTERKGEIREVRHATRPGIMNNIEEGVLKINYEDSMDVSLYLEKFNNEISSVWIDAGEVVYLDEGENKDYIITEEDDRFVFTLTGGFLDSLGVTVYESPHKIWIEFDYGLPVLLTIDVDFSAARYNPDIALDTEHNRYLMVYEKVAGDSTPYIYGRFVNADGEQEKEFRISEDKRSFNPKVVYNPENSTYMVVWEHEPVIEYDEDGNPVEYGDSLIYAQILDDEGKPYNWSGNFAVQDEISGDAYGQANPTIALNTSEDEYMIAWEEYFYEEMSYEIFGQILDMDGGQVGNKLYLTDGMPKNQITPILASIGNRYLLIFEDIIYDGYDYVDSNIKGRLYDSDGEFASQLLEIATGDIDQYNPKLATSGDGRFLVVWQEFEYEYDEDFYYIYGNFIDIDGEMLESFPVIQSDDLITMIDMTANNSDGDFLVVWEEWGGSQYDYYAGYFNDVGSRMGETIYVDSPLYGDGHGKLIYNPIADNYLAAYKEEVDGKTIIDVTIINVTIIDGMQSTAIPGDPNDDYSEQPNSEDITITNNIIGEDIIRVRNVLPGETVNLYFTDYESIPIEFITMPDPTESTYVEFYFEDGLPLGIGSVWVSITEVGKLESERTEKAIPIPVMREEVDFEVDTSVNGDGTLAFILTPGQIEDMEEATGKTISKIVGFVGELESDLDYLPELDDMDIERIDIEFDLDLGVYIGSKYLGEGNYPCAIAVYDDTDNVIAYYVHDGWKTVW